VTTYRCGKSITGPFTSESELIGVILPKLNIGMLMEPSDPKLIFLSLFYFAGILTKPIMCHNLPRSYSVHPKIFFCQKQVIILKLARVYGRVSVCQVWYHRQVNFSTFVRQIWTVALETTQGFILVRASWGPYIQFKEVFYMPKGLVAEDTSLGRERDLIPSLSRCAASV
jgi:hypothetical protein